VASQAFATGHTRLHKHRSMLTLLDHVATCTTLCVTTRGCTRLGGHNCEPTRPVWPQPPGVAWPPHGPRSHSPGLHPTHSCPVARALSRPRVTPCMSGFRHPPPGLVSSPTPSSRHPPATRRRRQLPPQPSPRSPRPSTHALYPLPTHSRTRTLSYAARGHHPAHGFARMGSPAPATRHHRAPRAASGTPPRRARPRRSRPPARAGRAHWGRPPGRCARRARVGRRCLPARPTRRPGMEAGRAPLESGFHAGVPRRRIRIVHQNPKEP
jgi:hypothetical protein